LLEGKSHMEGSGIEGQVLAELSLQFQPLRNLAQMVNHIETLVG
jgi:hypothetical protein